jgi:hypothetical protein
MADRKLIIGVGAVPPKKQVPGIAQLGPFTAEQFEQIRKGRITAWPISGNLRAPRNDSLRPLRRVTRVLDGDGNDTGQKIITVMQAPLTVRSASPLIDLTLHQDGQRRALQDFHATLCGYQQAEQLREAWLATHPRTLIIRLVTFAYHDVRDPSYYVGRVNGYTTTPLQSIDPDAPAITGDALKWVVKDAKARQATAKAKQQQEQAARLLAIRIKDAGRRQDPVELRAVAQAANHLADQLEQAA